MPRTALDRAAPSVAIWASLSSAEKRQPTTHSAPTDRAWATQASTVTDGEPSRDGNSTVKRSPGPKAQLTWSLMPPEDTSRRRADSGGSSPPDVGVTRVWMLTWRRTHKRRSSSAVAADGEPEAG